MSFTPLQNLEVYRRRLPHWRLPGSIYFVTWRIHPSQKPHELASEERSLVADAIRHFDGERFLLHGWVVMHDHAHLLIQPNLERDLSGILHSIKSYAANQLQRRFGRQRAVWQDESFDRIMRNEHEYFEKLDYVLTNPQRRWPEMREPYPWVGTGKGCP